MKHVVTYCQAKVLSKIQNSKHAIVPSGKAFHTEFYKAKGSGQQIKAKLFEDKGQN